MRLIVLLTIALLVTGCGTGTAPVPPSGPPASPAPSPTAAGGEPSPTAGPTQVPVLREGPGTFRIAPGGTERVGAGSLMRYRVEVEDGIEIDPAEFAAAVDTILADPRSWTAYDEWSFQRVSEGAVEFYLRLATPATVDHVCGQYWLDTAGEYSCRAGDHVMINLKRWVLGVPQFDGDLATYREYLINHEVGHRLGHGHVGCPDDGAPAPVMMQQSIDLQGCRPNGWPYPDR